MIQFVKTQISCRHRIPQKQDVTFSYSIAENGTPVFRSFVGCDFYRLCTECEICAKTVNKVLSNPNADPYNLGSLLP